MTYIRYVPSPPLDAYINCFYYRDHAMPYQREKILPMPWLNVMVNFGGAFRAYEADQAQSFATCVDSWIVGLWSAYHLIDWPQDVQFFTVDFKPGGAYPFLGVPLSEFYEQVVSLDTLWGQCAAEMRERMYLAPTVGARFKLLEEVLLARLLEAPSGYEVVQHAIGQISQQHGGLSIRALSDRLSISQKHLITQFKRLTGGTPKEFARMYRFQRIIHTIDMTQHVDWTALAHQSSYFDQSHFNKDFESFTGHTPTEYLRLRRRISLENPTHARYLRHLPTG